SASRPKTLTRPLSAGAQVGSAVMVSDARRGEPTPPIALADGAVADHLRTTRVEVDDTLLERLRGACADVVTDARVVAEASRDWWPLAMHWARAGEVGARGAVVARPSSPG